MASRIISLTGGKTPSRSGAKPLLSGLNGAVSVTCSPSAARVSPELSISSASTSSMPMCGAAIITEVALRRRFRISSRMARLTPGAMP